MKITSEPVSLDLEMGGVAFEPEDWLMCGKHFGLMHHLPTHAQYFVDLPKEAHVKETVSISEFRAWLTYAPEGIPSRAEQIELGRAAIAVFLQQTGLWKPEVHEIPDRPEDYRSKAKHRELINCCL